MFPMIELKHVAYASERSAVLHDVSLAIGPGEAVTIAGEGGTGKTVLFHLLIRSLLPTDGEITVDGADLRLLPEPVLQLFRSRMGPVFQEPVLLPQLTIAENIALPLELKSAPPSVTRRATEDLLSRLALDEIASLHPSDVSAGERRLAEIARALISAPMILLLDEPFARLNEPQRDRASALLLNMHTRGGTTVFFSRDANIGMPLHARTFLLQGGTLISDVPGSKTRPRSQNHHVLEDGEQHAFSSADTGKRGRSVRITAVSSR